MTILEELQKAPLFKDFGAGSGLETLVEIAQHRAVPAGTAVFVEDSVGDSLLVVASGKVRLTLRTQAGEKELAVAGPGDHLGEIGLLARTVRLVSAVAATDCEIVELTRRAFFKKAQEKPITCLKLATVIAAELARRVGENRTALRELAERKG